MHDLQQFLVQVSNNLQDEYNRITKCSIDDPGTAGDEGEENWAQLLRNWLPSHYKVVTKGQIITLNEELSPQIDILVLSPSYPPFLLNKKKYLSAGVVAGFECKLTLRKADIEKTIQNCVRIKDMCTPGKLDHKPGSNQGTPYDELTSAPIFGLITHSQCWKDEPLEAIEGHLAESGRRHVTHPKYMIDLICIANMATLCLNKKIRPDIRFEESRTPKTFYATMAKDHPLGYTPIGYFVEKLLYKLAWQDVNLRTLAKYFYSMHLTYSATIAYREWNNDIYSETVCEEIQGMIGNEDDYEWWDKWSYVLE